MVGHCAAEQHVERRQRLATRPLELELGSIVSFIVHLDVCPLVRFTFGDSPHGNCSLIRGHLISHGLPC